MSKVKLFIFKKKGSLSVMIILVFVTVACLVIYLEEMGRMKLRESYVASITNLIAQSILSEYHYDLNNEYSLFAVNGNKKSLKEKFEFYSSENLEIKNNDIKFLLDDYRLSNLEIFENSVIDYMKFGILHKLKEKQYSLKKIDINDECREIKNRKIINTLPSKNYEDKNIDIKRIPKLKDIVKQKKKDYLLNEYIMQKFSCGINEGRDTFFHNEIEYILYGKLSDRKNCEKFINDFHILRLLLNTSHIISSPKKRRLLMELAEIATPGAQAVITFGVFLGAWAEAETLNDISLIKNCSGVAFIKGDDDWAIENPERIIKGISNSKTIEPKRKSDFNYLSYIRLFLYFKNKEIKILRAMDIIQINIQGKYDKNFHIKDYVVGIEYWMEIKNAKIHGIRKY